MDASLPQFFALNITCVNPKFHRNNIIAGARFYQQTITAAYIFLCQRFVNFWHEPNIFRLLSVKLAVNRELITGIVYVTLM